MPAARINKFETTCIRVDILCDVRPHRGATSGEEVAAILRKLADEFDAGNNPMSNNEAAVVGASVDYY